MISRTLAIAVPFAALAALTACGDVEVAAESEMPAPLIDPLPLTVGIFYSNDFRTYTHAEERWGVDWKAELGPYHVRLAERLFTSAFRKTVAVKDLAALPADAPYAAIIEPRIEQYSFITPKDTGANYYAVTIKYRLNVLTPDGSPADSLTFTGYGSFKSGGVSSTKPMVYATKAAMRDAAAKFLVQFPEQEVTRKMVSGLPLIEPPAPAVTGTAQPAAAPDDANIELVPIVDAPPVAGASGSSVETPGAAGEARPPQGATEEAQPDTAP